jgi:V/A-type H+-transporting ATPase subunit I
VEIEKQVAEEQKKFVRSAKTIYFEAWVPEHNVKEAIERIRKVTAGTSIVTDESPAPDEKVPIMLKPVPSYLIAFEKLVYSFGYPSSGDVNPIRVLAITFPLLFGIMFADVGQGAIFVIMGIILTFLRRRIKLEEVGDIIQYLLISGEMFVFLGISSIFFGFVFGEFFGPSGLIHPISLGRIGPFYIGGFEPTHEPMKMLKFAIFVGAIHISLGLVFRFINEIRHKHYKLVPIPICWLWLLIGSLYMWTYWRGISNISKWFADGSPMLAGLIILPLTLILVFTGIAEGFMEGVGFSVEVFAETLSHSMSYSRLMALGLIHSAMNYLFLVLAGVEHGYFPLASIPLIAIGTILVMIIEGLVVFVHTLRLHWVEWFSKFHTGEGIPFKPFKHT